MTPVCLPLFTHYRFSRRPCPIAQSHKDLLQRLVEPPRLSVTILMMFAQPALPRLPIRLRRPLDAGSDRLFIDLLEPAAGSRGRLGFHCPAWGSRHTESQPSLTLNWRTLSGAAKRMIPESAKSRTRYCAKTSSRGSPRNKGRQCGKCKRENRLRVREGGGRFHP
jgi:hypothetical protein